MPYRHAPVEREASVDDDARACNFNAAWNVILTSCLPCSAESLFR